MRGPWNSMANILDESLREIYGERMYHDPLAFIASFVTKEYQGREIW
jgi:hypothetical protein